MGPPRITLFLDVVSPFAYIAFHVLRNDAVFKDVVITYVPIFLGGLMHACGNTAPIQIKNKDKWIGQERLRWATSFAVPMAKTTPEGFPPNTLKVMRALCGLYAEPTDGQELLVKALEKLFHEFWVQHAKVWEPEVYESLLRNAVGEERAGKALEAAGTTSKALLKENTDKAFETGAFGIPWMVCTDSSGRTEGFWGVDHFGQMVQFLGLEKPNTRGWKALL